MSAIVAALQSIPHLVLTRETKLTRSEKQLLPQLDEILAPQGDHRAYREALQNIKSPSAIPWLGAQLALPFPFLYIILILLCSTPSPLPGLGRPFFYSGQFAQPTNLLRP